MAGSTITPTRVSRDIGGVRKKEVVISIACLSDDTNGTVPNLTLTGLKDYVLTELKPIPHGTAPATSAFAVIILDENSSEIFDSGSIAVDSSDVIGAHTGSPSGGYPRMDATATLKIVDPANHANAMDIGNEKQVTLIARFEMK